MSAHPAQLHPLVPLPEGVLAFLPPYAAELQEAHPDEVIAAFTDGQAGVVGRRQLCCVGLTRRHHVGTRLQRRQLVTRFRGVYAPGHLHLGIHGHRTAAVLAVRGSLLSHGSANGLHGIERATGPWHVTVPGTGGRSSTQGIVVHSSTTLAPHDVCVVAGLPCTSVTRSVVDAAAYLSPRRIASVLARAERAGLLELSAMRETLERVSSRPTPGYAQLSEALREHHRLGAQLSRSEVESALHGIASQAGLPVPMLNRVVAGDEVDALWPDARLGIEIDSWEFHRDRRSFVADRAKLRRLSLQGFVVLPYAGADIVHRPHLVASELRAALARPRADI